MTKRETIANVLVAFGETTGRTVTELLINVFCQALDDYSAESIEAAAAVLLKTSRFFPTPADFVETIDGSPDDRAAAAWNLLVEALRKYSAWSSIEIADDAAFVYALESVFGSWIHCGDTLPDGADPMFASLRKQFLSAYRAYSRSGRRVALPHRLAGRHEANNLTTFATWRANTSLPPQAIYLLKAGQWREAALILDREQGRFETVRDWPQIGDGTKGGDQ